MFLPGCGLWLDPRRPRERAFVSHAHADHIARHAWTLCSPATRDLMRARGSLGGDASAPAFGARHDLGGGWTATLLPAGHVLGSAQLLIEGAEGSLLYTGDFKRRASPTCERPEFRHAETLVIETTYGLPRFVFPDADDVARDLIGFCREALADGGVPVVMAYSLGKAQEVCERLRDAGLPVMAHGAVVKIARVCAGIRPDLAVPAAYAAGAVAGHVLVVPPGAFRSAMVARLPNRRTAAVTGWGMDSGSRFRYGVDAVFPLSDHADYRDLLATVREVDPGTVWTVHGYAREFAADLRARGIEAWALGRDEQLDLPWEAPLSAPDPMAGAGSAGGDPPAAGGRGRGGGGGEVPVIPPTDAFGRLVSLARRLADEPAKRTKVDRLSEYFRSLGDPRLVSMAADWISGVPTSDPGRQPLRIGWKMLLRAVVEASEWSESDVRAVAARTRDSGRTVIDVFAGRAIQHARAWSLDDVAALLADLDRAATPTAKVGVLADAFRGMDADACSLLSRILLGDMRIGVKEGLVEEAVAIGYDREPAALRRAHMITGHLGECVRLAAEDALDSAAPRPGRPMKVMLAGSEPDAAAAWQRFAGRYGPSRPLPVEDKYDGVRCQAHVDGVSCRLFSRDRREISDTFPEIVGALGRSGHRVILDGEVLAVSEDAAGPARFQSLQRRLGRGGGDFFLGSEVPVEYVVFDILWVDGRSLLNRTLRERRRMLDALRLPGLVRRATRQPVASAGDLAAVFDDAMRRGAEGLMLKDEAGVYSPGTRGLSWIKLKSSAATLDAVVVRAEWGHGKRRDVLSDYTFAVRDTASGRLLEIGKAYSGLTDDEIARLTAHFLDQAIATDPGGVTVRPDTVLEIAFDSLHPSPRHASGLAMRFPRIVRVRDDKSPDEIDTLDHARRMAERPARPGKDAKARND